MCLFGCIDVSLNTPELFPDGFLEFRNLVALVREDNDFFLEHHNGFLILITLRTTI